MAATVIGIDQDVLQRNAANASPQKRLTRVEKAKLEALQAFGNHGFDSIVVKKCDFRTKLKATTPRDNGKNGATRTLTRMQKARLEANEAFKNIKLGEKRTRPSKRKLLEQGANVKVEAPKKTRLQEARLEAAETFQGINLGNFPKKLSTIEKEQLESRAVVNGEEGSNKRRRKSSVKGVKNKNRRRSSLANSRRSRRKSSLMGNKNGLKRMTRSQSAKLEVLKSFGGKGLDDIIMLPVKKEAAVPEETESVEEDGQQRHIETGEEKENEEDITEVTVMETQDEGSQPQEEGSQPQEEGSQPQEEGSQTQDEGSQTQDQGSQTQDEGSQTVQEEGNVSVPLGMVQNSTAIGVHPEEPKTPFLDISNISPIQEAAPKKLTRLEKAKIEALQSFSGKPLHDMCKSSTRIVSKYLHPKKDQATNTEGHQLRNKQSQTEDVPECVPVQESFKRQCRGNTAVYSVLEATSFLDQSTLLEASRRVVETAVQLETPEGSPVVR